MKSTRRKARPASRWMGFVLGACALAPGFAHAQPADLFFSDPRRQTDRVSNAPRWIRILAPAGRGQGAEPTEENPEGKPGRQYFRLISVFDISQTDEI